MSRGVNPHQHYSAPVVQPPTPGFAVASRPGTEPEAQRMVSGWGPDPPPSFLPVLSRTANFSPIFFSKEEFSLAGATTEQGGVGGWPMPQPGGGASGARGRRARPAVRATRPEAAAAGQRRSNATRACHRRAGFFCECRILARGNPRCS